MLNFIITLGFKKSFTILLFSLMAYVIYTAIM